MVLTGEAVAVRWPVLLVFLGERRGFLRTYGNAVRLLGK